MKKLFFLALVITILAAFFASTFPDGLEFVSEKFGFAQRGVEQAAPLAGYSLPFLPAGAISTAVAGIAGVLLAVGVFWLFVKLSKKSELV